MCKAAIHNMDHFPDFTISYNLLEISYISTLIYLIQLIPQFFIDNGKNSDYLNVHAVHLFVEGNEHAK